MLSTSSVIHMRAQELRQALSDGEEIDRSQLAQLADDMVGWAETLAVRGAGRVESRPSPLRGQARHYKPVFDVEPPMRAQIVRLSPIVLACVGCGGLLGALAGSLIGRLVG